MKRKREKPLEIDSKTIIGKYVKMNGLYGADNDDDSTHVCKVHNKQNKKQTERFSIEILLNDWDMEEEADALMEEHYGKNPDGIYFQAEDFHNDVYACSDEERDAAIALHKKFVSEWKKAKGSRMECECDFKGSPNDFLVCAKCSYHVCNRCAVFNQYFNRQKKFKCPECA